MPGTRSERPEERRRREEQRQGGTGTVIRRERRTEIRRKRETKEIKSPQHGRDRKWGSQAWEAEAGHRLHKTRLYKQATNSPQTRSREGSAHTELALHQDNLSNTGALPTHLVLTEESTAGKPDTQSMGQCLLVTAKVSATETTQCLRTAMCRGWKIKGRK